MGLFRRNRDSTELSLSQLKRWHLLLLPPQVTPEQVDALVRCRYPDSQLAETRRARLGRRSAISGPHELEPDELDYLKVPDGWKLAYALEVEPEPDPAAFDDIGDPILRAWWMRAFPKGKPFREEGDAVDLALAVARRYAGALRAAGSNVVLQPDHGRVVDLTIWSPLWISPEHMLALLAPILPGAYVDLAGYGRQDESLLPADAPWSVDPLDPLAVDLEFALDHQDHEIIHQVSAEHDLHALASGEVLDGYALTADGNLVVETMQEEAVPDWIRARVKDRLMSPSDSVVTYTVRWIPLDMSAIESEDPPYTFRIERDRIRPRMRAAALALAEAGAGVVSDAGGFEIDRYTL